MSPVAIGSLIGAVTFALSVGTSAFISGMRWGMVTTSMTNMDARLARIEGMFVMVPVQNLSPQSQQTQP